MLLIIIVIWLFPVPSSCTADILFHREELGGEVQAAIPPPEAEVAVEGPGMGERPGTPDPPDVLPPQTSSDPHGERLDI